MVDTVFVGAPPDPLPLLTAQLPDDLTGLRTYSEVKLTWASYALVKAGVLNYNQLLWTGAIRPGLLDSLSLFSPTLPDSLAA